MTFRLPASSVYEYICKAIFLHCPLFPSTRGIINKDNIAKMKDGAPVNVVNK